MIELENHVLNLAQQKLDSTALDGDCYFGIFYINVGHAPPECLSEITEQAQHCINRVFEGLNVNFAGITVPVGEQETKFELYSLLERK